MSGLVLLVILVSENPGGGVHPTVAVAVMTVPTHGVIALVLAWHERVESTLIRVRRGHGSSPLTDTTQHAYAAICLHWRLTQPYLG